MTLPLDFADQVTYFADLVAQLNAIASTTGIITVTSTTEPRQIDFANAWVAAGNNLPIPADTEFHWYTGTKLRGIYGTLRDGAVSHVYHNVGIGSRGCFSPLLNDERMLYIGPQGHANAGQIMIGDISGNRVVVANSNAGDSEPDWHNLAQKIVCATTQYGGKHIAKINTDGTGRTQVTTAGSQNFSPSWVGSKIVYVTDRHGASNEQIYSINDDGTGETRLTNNAFRDLLPHISPDGTKIVFISNRSGSFKIWTMNINGSSQTNLNIDAHSGGVSIDYAYPRWSADGTKIWFFKTASIPKPVGLVTTATQLWRCNADGSSPEQMSETFQGVGQWATPGTYSTSYFSEPTLFGLSLPYDETRFSGWIGSNPFSQIVVQAVGDDMENSTGFAWLLQPEHADWSDFQLLGEMVADGNITELVIESAVLRPEFDNILICFMGSVDSGGTSELLNITFNEDAANHYTLIQRGVGAVVTRPETLNAGGIQLTADTDTSDVDSVSSFYIYLTDIHSLVAYKGAIFHGGRINSYAAGGISHDMGIGYYASTNDTTKISIRPNTASLPFLTGTKISVYGLGGRGRFSPR